MNKCCICIPVMNVDIFIPKITTNAHTIGRQFTDYRIVFFYDLSHDGTINLIHDAQRESQNKIDILCNPHPQGKVPKTHHLAHARNSMIEHIRKNYSDFEYFIMMDADEVCTHPPNLDLFQRCMKRKDWDCLTFNKSFYYDLWALSMNHVPVSMWHFAQPNAYQIYIDGINYLIETCPPGELVRVLSAFNGFGIYRTQKFINSSYDGKLRLDLIPEYLLKKNIQTAGEVMNFHWAPDEASQDCEHRAFHMYARYNDGAEICICPEILFPDDPEFEE